MGTLIEWAFHSERGEGWYIVRKTERTIHVNGVDYPIRKRIFVAGPFDTDGDAVAWKEKKI